MAYAVTTRAAVAMSDASWAGIGAAAGAFVTGLFTWLGQRTKGDSDIEVAALAEWQKLYNALSGRVTELEKEIADMRREHAAQMAARDQQHATELLERDRKHTAEMEAMRRLNEGLQRQIAQNSQSTAHLIGDMKKDEGDAL